MIQRTPQGIHFNMSGKPERHYCGRTSETYTPVEKGERSLPDWEMNIPIGAKLRASRNMREELLETR